MDRGGSGSATERAAHRRSPAAGTRHRRRSAPRHDTRWLTHFTHFTHFALTQRMWAVTGHSPSTQAHGSGGGQFNPSYAGCGRQTDRQAGRQTDNTVRCCAASCCQGYPTEHGARRSKPWRGAAVRGRRWRPGRGRCVSIFLDKNRHYIGKSQPKRPPTRTQRPPHREAAPPVREAAAVVAGRQVELRQQPVQLQQQRVVGAPLRHHRLRAADAVPARQHSLRSSGGPLARPHAGKSQPGQDGASDRHADLCRRRYCLAASGSPCVKCT
jgi:hypothetical protein